MNTEKHFLPTPQYASQLIERNEGFLYSIMQIANNAHIATCYSQENATLIVNALNEFSTAIAKREYKDGFYCPECGGDCEAGR